MILQDSDNNNLYLSFIKLLIHLNLWVKPALFERKFFDNQKMTEVLGGVLQDSEEKSYFFLSKSAKVVIISSSGGCLASNGMKATYGSVMPDWC